MFKILLIAYFFIGILLVSVGPAKKSIAKAVNEVKEVSNPDLRSSREPISKNKIRIFRVIITIGFIFLWPFFLPGAIKDNNDF
jgi:hypothetical protein